VYVKRHLATVFKKALQTMPAILVTGPRQAGKTTFLKNEAPEDCFYVSFDDPMERSFANEDPVGFINRFSKTPVILDEIQYVPDLLPYIKMEIDKTPDIKGKWLMTGSQQFEMMNHLSESLAGRVGILHILPFHVKEYNTQTKKIDELIWNGGYPDVILNTDIRDLWIPSYISTYIERDVRQLLNVKDINQFQTFISLCASNHGQELNMASLSKLSGLSQPSCKRWITILRGSFILILLQPYFRNFGKRLIKSPKMYFLDSSIANYLTRQPSQESSYAGAMGGSFFKGFIITETYKILTSQNKQQNLYFWRSHDGLEVDLVLEKDGLTYAIEIKKTSTPSMGHGRNLKKFAKISKIKNLNLMIVSNTGRSTDFPFGIKSLTWRDYFKWLLK
jgi:predicted AAA+ superfamily ATPase